MDNGVHAQSGRGLLLVEAISHRWGWYPTHQNDGGKIVWALSPAISTTRALAIDT
jgi:hypothetical protein